jgi:hypothetical protein
LKNDAEGGVDIELEIEVIGVGDGVDNRGAAVELALLL